MLRLTTLGGLALEGERGAVSAAASSRRRIALLPLLAVAGDRGMSRDKLLAYLWPESDAERARHALTQALYALRRDLGEDALFEGTTELRLNPRAITSDVAELEAAMARGDLPRAAALYGGPFLDGFHLSGAPEFERWADRERQRLADLAARALDALAADAARRGEFRTRIEHRRRLTTLDPLSGRAAVELMTALADAGDRAGALRHAGVHAALVREELGVAPDPAVEALAERLRSEPPAQRAPAPARWAPAPTAASRGAPPAADGLSDDEERYLRHLQRALGGRYAPERAVEVSAMATAYAARDLGHGRPVTLTVIKPTVAAALRTDVFLRAMKDVRGLAHPHIVPLCDADVADGVLFYVMPAVDGETLRARLERERPMPVGEAVRIAAEVADALARVHEHGIIHRDVKPRHVVLDESGRGRALLANVGVAGAILRASGQSASQSGLVLGSPAYMSPEQLAGHGTIDGRSDIYSLACVLYEMLAGAPPFTGPTVHAVAAGRWAGPPPALGTLREAVPSGVERTVERALARVPADRFRTAAEFRDALTTP